MVGVAGLVPWVVLYVVKALKKKQQQNEHLAATFGAVFDTCAHNLPCEEDEEDGK